MDTTDSRIGRLQSTALFGGTSDEIVRLVLERAPSVRVAAGDYFFHEGERGVSIYWLVSGRVAILKQRSGEEVELRQLVAGDCFGEVALFDLGARSASVRAVEACSALELPPSLLREIRERDPEQYTLLTLNLGRELSRRLRTLERRVFRSGEDWDAGDFPPLT